jgi:ribosomal protein S27AE
MNKWSDQWSKEQRQLAWKLVAEAIATGSLQPQPCEVCGRPPICAHHDNYDRPLDIRWLCWKCHTQRHRELDPHFMKRRGRRLTDAFLTYQGETLSVSDWVTRVGLYPSTLYSRVFRLNWPVAFALWCRPCTRYANISRLARPAGECLRELQEYLVGQESTDEKVAPPGEESHHGEIRARLRTRFDDD